MDEYINHTQKPTMISINYGPNDPTDDRAYADLANAIVKQAADDWRECYAGLNKGGHMLRDEKIRLDEIRRFFNSEWCGMLCGDIDPIRILSRLEKELKKVQAAAAQRRAKYDWS